MVVLSCVCCRWGVVGFCTFVVLCGYEGADCEAEKLALTDQLLDAALGLWVDSEAAWPVLLVGCLV